MDLKINSTDNYSLTLSLNIDYEKNRVWFDIHFWDKVRHRISNLEYEADEMEEAMTQYTKLEKIIEKKEGK